jgi:hypothetical protein
VVPDIPLKYQEPLTHQHSVTSQKNRILNYVTVKASKVVWIYVACEHGNVFSGIIPGRELLE